MANLNEFRSDTRAINDGIWVRVNEAFGDLEIQVRGFTDGFHDARAARTAAAAEPYAGDEKRIPNAETRRINASLMQDFLIIGVRNLHHDDTGAEVTVEEFHKFLFQPEYGRLSRLCWEAAGRVSARSIAQVEAAAKNSEQDSGSN
jgi:hypothetical protein